MICEPDWTYVVFLACLAGCFGAWVWGYVKCLIENRRATKL